MKRTISDHTISDHTDLITLHLEDLISLAHIGISALERTIAQPILWDVRITSAVPKHPSVDYVDYAELAQMIVAVTQKQHWVLIEDLARHTAVTIIERFRCVTGGVVRLCKPYALMGVIPCNRSFARAWVDYPFTRSDGDFAGTPTAHQKK